MNYSIENSEIVKDENKRTSFRKKRKRNRKLTISKKKRVYMHKRKEYNKLTFYTFLNKSKFISNKRKSNKVKRNFENKVNITIPKKFSLIENPDSVLEVLKVLSALYKKNISGINFDHIDCNNIDIGASTLMDIFTLNLVNYHKKTKKNIEIQGDYPTDKKAKNLLLASGISKNLNIDNENRNKLLEIGAIKTFDLISGGKHTDTFKVWSKRLKSNDGSSVSDFAAQNVINYFNECLYTQGYELEDDSEVELTKIVGETINNCELHSGEFCQWFASGHYLIEDGEEYGEMHLSIINFGQTIYEGLKNSKVSEKMLKSLSNLTEIHTKNGFFKSGWDEETLWTLYALQDGVSRVRTDMSGFDRGNGTIDLISAFQSIGKSGNGKSPEMSIISGSAYIYFNDSHISHLREVNTINGTKRWNIAFNNENDLKQPPNEKHVRKMRNYFPGTAITLRFYLDKRNIERLNKYGEN